MSADISDFIVQFVDESEELLNEVVNFVISSGSSCDRDGIDYVFRVLHTVKGNAAILGFLKMKQIAHILEGFIDSIRSGTRVIDESFLDVFIEGTDLMIKICSDIRENMSEGSDEEYNKFIRKTQNLKY